MLIVTPTDLGRYIQDMRKEVEKTQTDLSEAVGVRQGTISSVECYTEKAKIGTLFRIMSELGLEVHIVPKGAPGPEDKKQEEWAEQW